VQWKWAAAVYPAALFSSTDNNALGVKPVDSNSGATELVSYSRIPVEVAL
jgi:hypothetical protein